MQTVVYYERLADSIPYDSIIAQNKDDTYSLRHLDELSPSTVTCVSSLSTRISSLEVLYFMLPCLPHPSCYDGPGPVLISVRWNGHTKGKPGGYFPHCVLLDITSSSYTLSARVSKETLQISGSKSAEEAEEVFLFIVDTINWCANSHCLMRSNWLHTMQSTRWIEDYACGEYVEDIVKIGEDYIDGNIVSITDRVGRFVTRWPVSVPDTYRDLLTVMKCCYADVIYTDEFVPRTVKILNSAELLPSQDPMTIYDTKVCMVNYNFHLGFYVDREMLCCHLRRLGHTAIYFNVEDHKVKVVVVDDEEYEGDDMIKRKGRKKYETTIGITMKGKVTVSGGGGGRLEKAYREVISDIIRICDENPSVMLD